MIEKMIYIFGNWRDERKPNLPDPGDFIDENWDKKEKDEILKFLSQGELIAKYRNLEWCRFRCGKEEEGSTAISDGYYVWAGNLSHYIEKHNVKPPMEFIIHAKKGLPKNTSNIEALLKGEFSRELINNNWWQQQRGTSKSKVQTYLTRFDEESQPYKVFCSSPTLTKVIDGRYQVVQMRDFGHLVFGYVYTMVSERLKEFLEKEVNGVSFEKVEIFRKSTGKTWLNYFSLITENEYNPEMKFMNISVDISGDHLWLDLKGNLYVTESLKLKLEKNGFDELSFNR